MQSRRTHAVRSLLASTTMILISGCGVPLSDCAWLSRIAPSQGWEQRWTRGEKEQIVAHNEAVRKHCR